MGSSWDEGYVSPKEGREVNSVTFQERGFGLESGRTRGSKHDGFSNLKSISELAGFASDIELGPYPLRAARGSVLS